MLTTNKPISDAELAELRRLHAAATPGEWQDLEDPGNPELRLMVRNEKRHQYMHAPDSTWCATIHNAFPAILARLEAAERERDDLEAEVEELRDSSIEYEKDCTKALCNLARELDYEWDGDGATADDLREFISETVADSKRRMEAIQAERDQLRAQLETASGNARHYADKCTALESTAAGLRRALEAGKADRWAATVGNTETNAFAPSPWVLMAETALAASPDEHERRIKAEALREFAKSRDIEVVGNGDWYAGIAAERTATVDDLRDTADRLEAANATL